MCDTGDQHECGRRKRTKTWKSEMPISFFDRLPNQIASPVLFGSPASSLPLQNGLEHRASGVP